MRAAQELEIGEGPYLCPGCDAETRPLSGPLKSPPPVDQQAEFCSYRCWLAHRAETGQDTE